MKPRSKGAKAARGEARPLASREAWAVAALAGFAFLRVWVLASAFPFFHNVDEHHHVDSVLRYARGELPGATMPFFDPQLARWAVRFGSWEFLEGGPEMPRPPWRDGASLASPEVQSVFRAFTSVENVEFDTSPAAYGLVGGWYSVLTRLGARDHAALYGVRWLNALLLAGLVVGSHALLRRVAPGDPLLRVGVPALLACFPQDAFLGVTPDSLAALSGSLAFVGVAALAAGRLPDASRFLLVGLALALAFLVKYTNAVHLVLAALASLLWLARGPGAALAARRLALLWGAALVPIGLWFARNASLLGEITGTRRKMAYLEWAPKPVGEWLDHPLFTASGALGYAVELGALFWRGEFLWHGEELARPWLDAAYGYSSLALLALAAWGVLRERHRFGEVRWTLEALAVLAVLGAAGQLALLSLGIEFADWGTPTRDHPFFVHGRLALGVLLPFAVVYVRGLRVACSALPGLSRPAAGGVAAGVLGAWLALVTLTELVLAAPAFGSPYNWFHDG